MSSASNIYLAQRRPQISSPKLISCFVLNSHLIIFYFDANLIEGWSPPQLIHISLNHLSIFPTLFNRFQTHFNRNFINSFFLCSKMLIEGQSLNSYLCKEELKGL